MSVTLVPGSACTFKIGATAYSSQVTGGSINSTFTITRTKTLSDVAYPLTDVVDSLSVDFLYDTEIGLVGALDTAGRAGTPVAVEVVMGDSKWSGDMYVENATNNFTADGNSSGSAQLVGTLVLADVAP